MSKFLKLNLADFGKSLLAAVGAVVLDGAYTLISANPGEYGSAAQWGQVLHSGVVAALAFLVANLFTNSKGEVAAEDVK